MKLYTFESDHEGIAVESPDGRLLDLRLADRLLNGRSMPFFDGMLGFIEAGEAALDRARELLSRTPEEALLPKTSVRILAPLPRPTKIRDFSCFEKHLIKASENAARIMAKDSPDPEAAYHAIRKRMNLDNLPGPAWYEIPGYYYSDATTVSAHGDIVTWPKYSDWIDYELELAAVIGKKGKDIALEDAMEHIVGYTIFNDLSARDAQFKAMATGLGPAKGKDFDGSNPLGPCIVTRDEIPDPYALNMRARINGEVWSEGHSSEAKWRFPDCIAYASQSQTLYPGEVFATGTVGDGCSLELARTVVRGDIVELEIERIGVLRTHIV